MGSNSTRPARPGKAGAGQQLVKAGMPVFTCRLDSDGNPSPPRGWENTRADPARAERWRPGLAMCGVTGTAFDVLDIDPRNGGRESLAQMIATLGDDGPEVYWRVATPSGGWHYIEPLGIGSHNGILPGIDLKGGRPDGTGRGFVFLPGTVRPSKVTGRPGQYRPLDTLAALNGHGDTAGPLREYLEARLAERAIAANGDGSGGAGGRRPAGELRQACLAAEAGAQRGALLRLVHEYERKGYEPG